MKFYAATKEFALLSASQNKRKIKGTNPLICCVASLIVSGCVSQQSTLDFGGVSPTPVASTNVSLVDNGSVNLASDGNQAQASIIPVLSPRKNLANIPTTPQTQVVALPTAPTITTQPVIQSSLQNTAQSNVSQIAPLPTTPVASQITAAAPAIPATTNVATVPTPTLTTTNSSLAIADTNTSQATTGNVIASATSTPSPTVAVANTTPVTPQKAVVTGKIANVSQENTDTSVEVASLSPSIEAASTVETPASEAVKKQGFFQRLFAPIPKAEPAEEGVAKPQVKRKAPRPSSRVENASLNTERSVRTTATSKQKTKTPRPTQVIKSASVSEAKNTGGALPGVKSNSEIFGIKDEPRKVAKPKANTQVASVGSFGRLSPNDLRVQHSGVQVACLKPGVLRILKMVERRYGKKPIITSGYRSPKGNRRAGGARNSQHIFCKAVDIQVEGVSKWKLAKYIRTLPGRGGVGTYCRTKSVHFDIGSVRNWHHPCRKSSKRKRKKT